MVLAPEASVPGAAARPTKRAGGASPRSPCFVRRWRMGLMLHAFWYGQRLWLWCAAVAFGDGGGGRAGRARVRLSVRGAIGDLPAGGLLAQAAAAGAAGRGGGRDGMRQEVVKFCMGGTADALIRRCVSEDPFFGQPAERLSSPNVETRPPETRWVAALLGDDPRVSGPDAENARVSQ